MVEAALQGYLKDSEFRVAQQGDSPEQAHFHSEIGDGTAKPLMEQAVEVAATTTEPASQFGNRQPGPHPRATPPAPVGALQAHAPSPPGVQPLARLFANAGAAHSTKKQGD
jgi:hypothetical protein